MWMRGYLYSYFRLFQLFAAILLQMYMICTTPPVFECCYSAMSGHLQESLVVPSESGDFQEQPLFVCKELPEGLVSTCEHATCLHVYTIK